MLLLVLRFGVALVVLVFLLNPKQNKLARSQTNQGSLSLTDLYYK